MKKRRLYLEYPIYADGEAVGKVELIRSGLYYELFCQCRPIREQMSELVVQTADTTEKLGLLIPKNGSLQLHKKVPIKRLGEGQLRFALQRRGEDTEETVAVDPEKPFAFLERLNDAYLVTEAGESRIAFRK